MLTSKEVGVHTDSGEVLTQGGDKLEQKGDVARLLSHNANDFF